MLRQFRKDDTHVFSFQYGKGSKGSVTFTTNTTLGSSHGAYWGSFTGNQLDFSGPTGLANGIYNLPCKIVQTAGTGATANPNHELNFLLKVDSGIAYFLYPLTITFNSGAQIITSNDWKDVVINNSVTLTIPAWDGSKGGELFLIGSGKFDNSAGGNIDLRGLGFRGGVGGPATSPGSTNSKSTQGESYIGAGDYLFSANGNAGGGSDGTGSDGGNGGGGGGNKNAGSDGAAGQATIGAGGIAVGNDELTTMILAGPGGGGRGEKNGSGGNGANAPADLEIIFPTIIAGIIHGEGSNGGNASSTSTDGAGGGGASAGNNQKYKGQDVTIGSGTSANSATGGTPGLSAAGAGGNSSVGRIHIDYGYRVAGDSSSTPNATTRQDLALVGSPSMGGVM